MGAAALLLVFAVLFFYQKTTPEGHLNLTGQDWTFFAVIAGLILLALYLVKAIKAEIDNGDK